MNREQLKIAIIEDDKTSLLYLELLLRKLNLNNIISFQNSQKFIEYFSNCKDIDFVFINYQLPDLNGIEVLQKIRQIDKDILTIMMTASTEVEVRQEAIKYGINEFMNKDIRFPEFFTKINILINLRLYFYKIKAYEKSIKGTIKYKNIQEKMALKKQYKIIKDDISNHFYGNWLADSYFKPHDIVSGDSYIALQLNNNNFFVAIVDGMGKGISASLSSVLTIAFLNYSITKSLEFNDYKFNRIVNDVFNYVKTIMLEHESLSFTLVHIKLKQEKIYYANFGLPSFYIKKEDEILQIKPNNTSLLSISKDFQIDTYKGFDSLLIASDGLIEAITKDNKPYFMHLRESFIKFNLFSELLKDFEKQVEIANDDTTIFMIAKDKCKYKIIYKKKLLITEQNIEKLPIEMEKLLSLNNISSISIELILFALNELLLNVLEHSVYKIGENKQKIVKNDIKIEYNNEKECWVNLKLKLSKKFILIELNNKNSRFDINKVLNAEWYNKFHGRGLKMLKFISNGLYYNKKGNKVKFYLKRNIDGN